MKQKYSENIRIVLELLQNEVDGNVSDALAKLTEDYSMTWVYRRNDGSLFPKTSSDVQSELEEVYPLREREYRIKNIAESENLVIIKMIESYPDEKTGKIYRTPQVIVLEMRDGKVRTGRHYCDPNISFLYLSEEEVSKAYRERTEGKDMVIRGSE